MEVLSSPSCPQTVVIIIVFVFFALYTISSSQYVHLLPLRVHLAPQHRTLPQHLISDDILNCRFTVRSQQKPGPNVNSYVSSLMSFPCLKRTRSAFRVLRGVDPRVILLRSEVEEKESEVRGYLVYAAGIARSTENDVASFTMVPEYGGGGPRDIITDPEACDSFPQTKLNIQRPSTGNHGSPRFKQFKKEYHAILDKLQASVYDAYNHCKEDYLRQLGVDPKWTKVSEIKICGSGRRIQEKEIVWRKRTTPTFNRSYEFPNDHDCVPESLGDVYEAVLAEF
ncbi:hypothetical protein CSHISOI_10615, partial [Colletotrichum shisoi]